MYFKKVFLSTLARLTRNLLLIIDTLGERSIFRKNPGRTWTQTSRSRKTSEPQKMDFRHKSRKSLGFTLEENLSVCFVCVNETFHTDFPNLRCIYTVQSRLWLIKTNKHFKDVSGAYDISRN